MRGEVVESEEVEERERMERVGEKAVRRRWREVVVVRRGVKDWKRFVRVVEGISSCWWFVVCEMIMSTGCLDAFVACD